MTSYIGAVDQGTTTWHPDMDDSRRTRLYDSWQKAVKKSFGWC